MDYDLRSGITYHNGDYALTQLKYRNIGIHYSYQVNQFEIWSTGRRKRLDIIAPEIEWTSYGKTETEINWLLSCM